MNPFGYLYAGALILVGAAAMAITGRILIRSLKSGTMNLRDKDTNAVTPIHREENAPKFWFWWLFFAGIGAAVGGGFVWQGIRAIRVAPTADSRAVLPVVLVLAVVAWWAWVSWRNRSKQKQGRSGEK